MPVPVPAKPQQKPCDDTWRQKQTHARSFSGPPNPSQREIDLERQNKRSWAPCKVNGTPKPAHLNVCVRVKLNDARKGGI